jgi:hypothetical protein
VWCRQSTVSASRQPTLTQYLSLAQAPRPIFLKPGGDCPRLTWIPLKSTARKNEYINRGGLPASPSREPASEEGLRLCGLGGAGGQGSKSPTSG